MPVTRPLSSPHVELPDDVRMPLLGVGTWQLSGGTARQVVAWALESGYRHVDTATGYGNEREVGAALRESGLDRDEVFVTTKLPPENAGRERETLEQSLEALGTDHLDLWLVHWPPDGQAAPRTWEHFVQARQEGLVRAIGVSNYSLGQLDELTQATGTTPAVNQIRWSPFVFDGSVLEGHRDRGVVLEGYSPFKAAVLDHPVLTEIAERHGKTPAQVVVRWHVQHGIPVIPKSEKRERLESNVDVLDLELDDDEMARLDGLAGQG